MNEGTILFFLAGILIVLAGVIFYRQMVLVRGIRKSLRQAAENISEILTADSDEKIMAFTDDKALMELYGQINRLLLDRQKVKTDYKRQEIASKKMLANISHDIKTPLTVILGYLEIMRLNDPEDEQLQKVEAKAVQVVELINEFFTLAKLEAGDMNLEITKINVSELCRENVLGFYELLLQKEFEVDISLPEQNIFVQGDKESIERIFNNLLSNAIRYGSDGKYIGIFLRKEGSFVYLDVVDKGKGIEKDFAPRVFERLYTMEDSRSRQIQGNGLGLTIARNLARQLGGDILLESAPGIKTVFTLKLKAAEY